MNLDKTSIIAIVLCFVGYLGYETYLNKKYPDRFNSQKSESTSSLVVEKSPTSLLSAGSSERRIATENTSPSIVYNKLSVSDLQIENDTTIYKFDQNKGALTSIRLKTFQNENHDGPVDLIDHPLEIYPSLGEHQSTPNGFNAERKANSLSFSRQEGHWLLTHTYNIDPKGYGVTLDFHWKNLGNESQDLVSMIFMNHIMSPIKKSGFSFLPGSPTGHPFLIAAHDSNIDRFDAMNLCKTSEKELVHSGTNFNLGVLAFDLHYFVGALLPQGQQTSYRIVKNKGGENQDCSVTFMTENKQGLVKASEDVHISYKAWFGPKSTYDFGSYDSNLEKTLDLGFFAKISHPLLSGLHFLNNLVKNWGLAIVILTMFLKLLFYPLTRQAAISMNRMKKLQPDMNKIREKFKDDPQRMQQEIMKFMSLHKVNPMKGCLPILPQIPVFFAFYRVLSTSIELRHAPFFGWIHDLSSADPFFITPLLLGVAMFLQQKLTPTAGLDKAQERVMMMLPIMFTVMMLTLPAGMVIYMLTNTIISIAQQQWLNRRLQ